MNPVTQPSSDTTREVPLRMDPETFRACGHALVDQLAELLASVPTRRVAPGHTPDEVRKAFGLHDRLPKQGMAPQTLLTDTARLVFEHSLFNAHPRFLGYITASPAPIGMLGELIAAAANPNVGSWTLGPAATEIELQTVRWIAELIGYPTDCGGLLVSGGNMANMVGFWAARAAKAPWNVRAAGVTGGPKLRCYASAETHTWIYKAADLAGLGTDSVRFIPVDESLRMDLAALERAIAADRAAGELPFMVVGTGGSVSTGAVDDLPAIGALCKREQLWFHVDGAYGGIAAAVKAAPEDLRGLALADSVAVDPHKWLYAPIEAGCALIRDSAKLHDAFSYHPPYYLFDERVVNFVDYGPQNSRGFRALKVWLQLRHAGGDGYRRMVSDDIALAGVLADAVRATPELEFWTNDLSITTYRFVPEALRPRLGQDAVDTYLDELNKQLNDRMQRGGEAFVSNAVIRGRYVLRACCVNFNTTAADMRAVADITVRTGRAIDSELRPAGLK